MFNTIETARLILRPWRTDDLKDLECLFADPAVRLGRHLPPERIISVTAPWNTAARRVMERIGLEYQGYRQGSPSL